MENVCKVKHFLYGQFKAGVPKSNLVGNYGDIQSYLDIDSIANILSVYVINFLVYHITYYSDDG